MLGIRKRKEFWDFIDKAKPQPELILLQEHHLSLEDCLTHTHQLDYKGGVSLWNNALFNAEGNRFKAGTGIIIGAKLAPFIIETKVIIEGRAQFVILELGRKRVGVLNIYAQNHTATRAKFWITLSNYNFPEAHWVVAGDFNMTKNEEDRSPRYIGKAMGVRELQAWTQFAIHLGINDAYYANEFCKIGSKQHTWCREKPLPIWSRLDRFYVDGYLQALGGRHGIWPTLSHISDHAATFLQITLDQIRSRGNIPFNNALLKNPSSHNKLIECWKRRIADPTIPDKTKRLIATLADIKKGSDRITTRQKKEGRQAYEAQFLEVREAESALERNWYDLEAWDRLNLAQQNLEEVRMERLDRKRFAARANWARMGDRCSS